MYKVNPYGSLSSASSFLHPRLLVEPSMKLASLWFSLLTSSFIWICLLTTKVGYINLHVFSGIKMTPEAFITNVWFYLRESKLKIITIINICVAVYNSHDFKYVTSFEAHKSQMRWERERETASEGHNAIKWQKQNLNPDLLVSHTMLFILWQKCVVEF